jgi:hypothetical protein
LLHAGPAGVSRRANSRSSSYHEAFVRFSREVGGIRDGGPETRKEFDMKIKTKVKAGITGDFS